MKKTTLLYFILMLNFTATYAQANFDKLEEVEGVSTIIVNKMAFSLMSQIGTDSDEDYLELIKNLESLEVYAAENGEVSQQLKDETEVYLSATGLEKLMSVKEGTSYIKIYAKPSNKQFFVTELFMFVEDDSNASYASVITLIKGDIDLREVSKLAEKMNLPGGEHLEKVGE